MRIGIDLGGTKMEGIVMDSNGKTLHKERMATPAEEGYQAVVERIVALVQELERQASTTCTVGIGTPGAISNLTGLMKNSNATCLNGQPLAKDLERLLSRPVRMANDANCFTLSEALDGAAANCPVVFGVILGTGVGGGISFAGKIHNGPNAIAGEWGHNPMFPDGPSCYCGKQGCVETLLSGPGLFRDYQRHGGHKASSTSEMIAHIDQDQHAETAMQRYMDRLARALAFVINILDPDAIVLGGGLSNITKLYQQVPLLLPNYVFSDEVRTPLLQNHYGDASGVRGAAMLW